MAEPDSRFLEMQQRLGLPLPSTAPKSAFDEGLALLQALQRSDPKDFESMIEKFGAWSKSIRANFE